MTEGQTVKFSIRDWVWLVFVIASSAIGSMSFVYSTSQAARAEMNERIDTLDDRWQKRLAEVLRDVKSDIADVKSDVDDVKIEIKDVQRSIPPDWFRKMVEGNQQDIRNLQRAILELKGTKQ